MSAVQLRPVIHELDSLVWDAARFERIAAGGFAQAGRVGRWQYSQAYEELYASIGGPGVL